MNADAPRPTVRVRRATAHDARALADIAARTFAAAFGDSNSPEDLALHLPKSYSEAQQGAEIADPDVDVLLAEVDDSLAGYAQLRVGEAPACVAHLAPFELWRFYVDTSWHGRGVAQALMEAVADAARARGASALWLSVWEHNPRAQAFYAKCGFVQAGTKPFVVGTDVQNDWVMLRRFAGEE